MEHPYSVLRRAFLYLGILALVALFSFPARGQSAERLHRFNVSTTPPSTLCDEAKEAGWLWWDTDADTDGALYICKGAAGWKAVGGSGGSGDITDVWTDSSGDVSALTAAAGDSLDAGSADASSPATRSTSLPGTCSEGQFHQDTDSTGSEVYACTAANTWTKFLAATDNIATATALAANGANCSSGSAPLGVDASGAVESCADYEEDLANSAGLAAALSDETGSAGVAVFAASPALTGDPTVGGVSVCLEDGTNCPSVGAGSDMVWSGATTGNLSNSATNYFSIVGIAAATASEGTVQIAGPNLTMSPARFDCLLSASPGSGNSYTFTLRGNGSDLDWECVISDAANTCSDTSGSTIAGFTAFTVRSVPASTPTARQGFCSLTFSL